MTNAIKAEVDLRDPRANLLAEGDRGGILKAKKKQKQIEQQCREAKLAYSILM